MKIIVVGAIGTIGAAVAKALAANKHEVVAASRNGAVKVNLDDPASIRAMFEKVRDVDAVISCAGNAVFKPLAALTDAVHVTRKRGDWLILVVHGIGFGMHRLFVEPSILNGLLDHLAAQNEIWVAPVAEIAKWVRAASL